MTIAYKAATAGIAVAAILSLSAGAANAATADSAKVGGATQGFDFRNLSTIPMRMTYQTWPTGHYNEIVNPGQSIHMEVPVDGIGDPVHSQVGFKPVPQTGNDPSVGGQAIFDLDANAGINNPSTDLAGNSNPNGFTGGGEDQGQAFWVTDPAGTNVTLDGVDAQGNSTQAEQLAILLHQLCDSGSSVAQCKFDEKSDQRGQTGEFHQVGESAVNGTDSDFPLKTTMTDNVGVTDTIGGKITVGTKLFGMINAAVELSAQHSITNAKSFSQEIDQPVKAGDTVWVLDSAPVIRDTGDFTVKMGNTTYNFTNVSFDSPEPVGADGSERYGQFLTCSLHHQGPNPAENKICDEHQPSGASAPLTQASLDNGINPLQPGVTQGS